MMGRTLLRRLGFYLGLFLFALFAVFPVLVAGITSLKHSSDLYNIHSNPFWFGVAPTLKHVTFLFTNTHYPLFLWNSFIIGVLVVVITLVLSVPAAYSLARLTGRWGERSGMAIFLVYLIPPTLLFIPLFQIITTLHVSDTIWALVLVYPTITVPFCTWLLLGFFKSLPRELEEAAMIDGCSRWQAFARVSLPMSLPGVAACIVFAFALSLSDYIYATTFISSASAHTVSAGVPTELIRGDIYFWQSLMAAAVIVTIPLAVAYGLLFERLVKGFQSAAT